MGSLSRELLEEIFELTADGLLIVDAADPEIMIVRANAAWLEMTGFAQDEIEGSSWLAQAAVEDEAPELVQLRQSLVGDEPVELTLPYLRKDGEIRVAHLHLKPLKHARREQRLWLVRHAARGQAIGDSAELLKRALSRARHKLTSVDRTDAVTGLMSRSHFELMLKREIAIARREGTGLSLMLFAVPELDIYRQTFGDNAADSCLRMIGAQMSGTFRRASDLCARFDGALLAAAIRGQSEAEARQLVALVEGKARNLGLHNPRGRVARMIFLRGACVLAEAGNEDFDGLIARGLDALDRAGEAESRPAAVTG